MFSLKLPKILFFLFGLITLNSSFVIPQSFNVTHYSEQSGLVNSAVWSSAQDGEGRMWFATKKGVSVYDGLNWHVHAYSSEATGPLNIKLSTDERGDIWVIARNTDVFISYFNGKQLIDKVRSPYFSGSTITSFIVDTINSKRFVFASGRLGEMLFCYDTTWKTIIISAETKISRIYSAIRKDNGVILATDKGLYKFNPLDGNISKIEIELPFIAKGLYWENTDQGGRLLVGGGTIFGYIENDRFIKLTDKLIITYDEHNPVLLITPDRKGGYFLGNQFSLYFYSTIDKSLMTLGIINGLIATGATSVLTDVEKNIWITTLRGVSKISTRTFINYENVFQNNERDISAIIEYEPGNIIFGGNYGVSFYNGVNFRYVKLIDSLVEEAPGLLRILDLYKDNKNNVWAATHSGGFFIIDKNLKKLAFEKSSRIEGYATSIQQEEDGEFWLSTSTRLYKYDGNNLSTPKEFPYQFNIRKIIKLRNKDLLFCAPTMGAYLKTGNVVKMYTSPNNNFQNVYSAFLDLNGKLFLGTAGGLCEIRNDSIVKGTLNNNLTIDRPIYLILKDSTNNLWFGTDLGVIRYDGEKLYSYTTKDGFAGNEVNRSAGLVDHNNRVWFGTNNGVSCYYREYDSKLDTNTHSPVIIKNINSQKNLYSTNENLEFSYKDNDITFIVFGISFIDEKENKIRWKLDGFDNQWTAERPYISNEIFYDNVNPGSYKLMVQMKNANGIWGPVTASPEFTINKPYYLRWWFMVFGVIVLGFLVYTVQHYFEQRKYNYFLKKEIDRVTTELKETETNYRDTLLKEIHHRVKNNMQIISSLLSLQSNRETDPHLNDVIKESQNRIRSMALIHEKLYQSKKFSELDLSSYVNSLIEYLKRIYLVNTSLIKVNLNIDEIFINIDIAIACGLIINELVSNSFKYAFPDNAKGAIFVEIHKQGKDTLFLSIKDNGIGIKNLSDLENSDSLGLKLVKMLIKQHQGEYLISDKDGALFEIKLLIVNESV